MKGKSKHPWAGCLYTGVKEIQARRYLQALALAGLEALVDLVDNHDAATAADNAVITVALGQ